MNVNIARIEKLGVKIKKGGEVRGNFTVEAKSSICQKESADVF